MTLYGVICTRPLPYLVRSSMWQTAAMSGWSASELQAG